MGSRRDSTVLNVPSEAQWFAVFIEILDKFPNRKHI